MPDAKLIESGAMGRVAYARIAPNEDLVQGVEKFCLVHGFRNAFVRGALGSLVDACLARPDGRPFSVSGPAVAMPDGSVRASLTGVVADPQGHVYGGPFIAGANPICMTFEVTLEEWLPTDTLDRSAMNDV
jgi:uncharacterized protein